MNHNKTDLQVSTAEAAADALHYARNAMLSEFSVTLKPEAAFPLDRADLRQTMEYALAPYNALPQLQNLMTSIYQEECGSFAAGQQHAWQCSGAMHTFARKAQLDATVQYLSSAKEANDLTCLAAEIGAALKAQLGSRPTLEKIFHVYQKWINSTFRYVRTGQPADHSAAALMRTRSGVCQAIAALTVLVLPHLGLLTQYVSGQGGGAEGLGPHAWNVVRVPGASLHITVEEQLKWYHVDFTFGMNGFTPHTLNAFSAHAFEKTHAWDEEQFSQAALNARLRKAEALRGADIVLWENSCRWLLGGVTVTSPHPLLTGDQEQGHWVDLYTLLRFLSGGCEFVAAENRLRVCLGGHQWLVENANRYLNGPEGYLSVSVLRHLPLQIWGTETSISMKAVIL